MCTEIGRTKSVNKKSGKYGVLSANEIEMMLHCF